jgi:predicted dienelactone hydrolase
MRNRIDLKRPDAPELAAFGPHLVGAMTKHLVNPDQIDVMAASAVALPRYDRALCVEYWYPAAKGSGQGGSYDTVLRDGHRKLRLHGIAMREAEPGDMAGPLVILSHGFPGNRHLMAHFAEHLASHGYRVAAIDHTDSTYDDPAYLSGVSFGSTLINRPLDTAYVAGALGGDYAIIGYSMGGYGALVSGGAGVAQAAVRGAEAPPSGLLALHQAPLVPPKLKAILPIGPWGRQRDLWDAKGLANLSVPCLIIAGTEDDISGYDTGMRKIFDEAGGLRWLLSFAGAGHNAAAPIPCPEEGWEPSEHLKWSPHAHYADGVWDTVRMNNIAQHFALGFLDWHLKGQASRAEYFAPGWKGFEGGRAPGLWLETKD